MAGIDLSDRRNIVLTGFISSGKSSTGRIIAKTLGIPMFDTDFMIEQASGKSRAELFEEGGEELFRRIEAEQVRAIADKEGIVVSCGGGIVTRHENTALLRRHGAIILLHARLDVVMERLAGRHNRPILDSTDHAERIRTLYHTRKPLYHEAADLIIDTGALTPPEVAERVIAELRGHSFPLGDIVDERTW